MTEPAGLFDTSVFVALESGRSVGRLPGTSSISVVTLGELHAGVLAARDSTTRARRLSTLAHAEASFGALPITEEIAREWGRLVTMARDNKRRAPINDIWIAATASVHGLVVVTQDRDYDGLDVPVLRV